MIPNVISTGYRISNMSLRAYGSAGVGALIQDGSFQARILIKAKQQALDKVCQRLRLKRWFEKVTGSFFTYIKPTENVSTSLIFLLRSRIWRDQSDLKGSAKTIMSQTQLNTSGSTP